MARPETDQARYLRRNMTNVEWRLWSRLRGRQLDGYRFRRQAPIGPYFADFVCLSARLVIEIDGPLHGERLAKDARRTAWLEAEGYRVLSFTADYVAEQLDDALEVVRQVLLRPHPHPASPPGGEECDEEADSALA